MRPYAPIIVIALLCFCLLCGAQSQGPDYPNLSENQPLSSCTGCAGAVWNNANKVNGTDGVYADVQLMPYLFCFQSQCYRSRYLTSHHFGFSIPSSATVDGIVVTVTGKSNTMASVMDSTIMLMKNYVPVGANRASGNDWDTSAMVRTYGSPLDLWGSSWTPAEINDNYFGSYVKVYNPTTNTPSALVDAVTITVFYSIGTQVFAQTSSPGSMQAFYDTYSEKIRFSCLSAEDAQGVLELTDSFGKLCFSKVLQTGAGQELTEEIPGNALAPGIYFCSLRLNGQLITRKLAVTH
jgi:hypothetical protein